VAHLAWNLTWYSFSFETNFLKTKQLKFSPVQQKIKRPALFILSMVETFSIKKRLETPEYLQASKQAPMLSILSSISQLAGRLHFIFSSPLI
jgi:hypothetical protein